MSFILRIFFSGLIAFVPSPERTELTVLVVDSHPGESGCTHIEPHLPLLLARAASCTGDCGTTNQTVAHHLFPEAATETASISLSSALSQGAVWQLSGSDLELALPQAQPLPLQLGSLSAELGPVPLSAAEREDFRWVADIGSIDPDARFVDPDVLAPRPQRGLIAARLKLQAGRILTYRLVAVDNKVVPIRFRTQPEGSQPIGFSRAVASWVMAEIHVSGDSVTLAERSFAGEPRRTIALSPGKEGGIVEVALLNIPKRPAAPPSVEDGQPGEHFGLYYELAKVRPPARLRPVPVVGSERTEGASVEWSQVHPPQDMHSDLLDGLMLGDPRGIYSAIICPVAQFSAGGGG